MPRLQALHVALGSLALASGLDLAACSSSSNGTPNDCTSNDTCPSTSGSASSGASASSGTSASSGSNQTPDASHTDSGGSGSDAAATSINDGSAGADGDGGCDPTAQPMQASCVITEAYGIFVSPNGTPNGAGTRTSPLSSVNAAVAMAKAQADAGTPKRVYVCDAYYNEALTLDSTNNGLQIYGGLDCTNWTYDDGHTGLTPTAAGPALLVSGMASLQIYDFEFDSIAAPQTEPTTPGAGGASSIGVSVASSTGVLFERVIAVAGKGQPGQDEASAAGGDAGIVGGDGGELSSFAPSGSHGVAAPGDGGSTGGASTTNPACTTSEGGAGGSAAAGGAVGSDGVPGASDKGTVASCTGKAGANGTPGTSGAGAAVLATLGSTGWTSANGQPGGAGSVGQGGGGGASTDATGGGGGGGAGGCGGGGGAAGTGGGSSISILVYQSKVDLEGCTLDSDDAGNGGHGASGDSGQAGGPDGSGAGNGCAGGNGGNGGNGGGGGGGAGGVSAGVVWTGTSSAITIDGNIVMNALSSDAVRSTSNSTAAGGAGGAGGTGGQGSAGASGGKGIDGQTTAVLGI